MISNYCSASPNNKLHLESLFFDRQKKGKAGRNIPQHFCKF